MSAVLSDVLISAVLIDLLMSAVLIEVLIDVLMSVIGVSRTNLPSQTVDPPPVR